MRVYIDFGPIVQAPMATTTTLKENKKRVNNYEQIKE